MVDESFGSDISEEICRICHDTGNTPLYSVCDCKGSIGKVHKECLNQWIHCGLIHKKTPQLQCELCKQPLPLHLRKLSLWQLISNSNHRKKLSKPTSELFFHIITLHVFRKLEIRFIMFLLPPIKNKYLRIIDLLCWHTMGPVRFSFEQMWNILRLSQKRISIRKFIYNSIVGVCFCFIWFLFMFYGNIVFKQFVTVTNLVEVIRKNNAVVEWDGYYC